MPSLPADMPRRLAAIRRATGLSQEALARLIGCSVQEISRWERGLRRPNTEHRRRLIRHLGQPAAALFATLADNGDDEAAA